MGRKGNVESHSRTSLESSCTCSMVAGGLTSVTVSASV